MKIAYITSTYFPNLGGAESMLHNLLGQLQEKHNINATLYVPYKSYRYLVRNKMLTTLSYRVKSLFPFSGKIFLSYPSIADFLGRAFILREQRLNKYDAWHVSFAYPAGYMISFLKSVPTILQCHGVDVQVNETLDYGIRRNSAINDRVIHTLKNIDILIAMSQTMEDEYRQVIFEKNKIVIIPHGVDSKNICLDRDKKNIREELGIPLDKKIIITVGKNHPKKGYQYIFEVIKCLLDMRDDFIWLVVGKNSAGLKSYDRYSLVNKCVFPIEHIGIDNGKNKIQAPETLPPLKLIEYYNASDLFVFPSLLESFGIVLIEAMAAGLAVVAFDAPGTRDIIKNGHNGLCVPSKDTKAMAGAINRIFEDVGLKENLIENALKDIREKYDWTLVAQKYAGVYKELIEKNKI